MADNAAEPEPISRKRNAQSLECHTRPGESHAASQHDLAGSGSQCEPSRSESERVASKGIVAGLVSRIERGELAPPLKRAKSSVDEGNEQADLTADEARRHRTEGVPGTRIEEEGSALPGPREGPRERDADVKRGTGETRGVESKGVVSLCGVNKSATKAGNNEQDAGIGELAEKEQVDELALLKERGRLTWEQQWMVAAVEGVVGRLVDAEEEETSRLVVAHQRHMKASAAVSRAAGAASEARQAWGNLEEARRQAMVELNESQAALEEAKARLEDLRTAQRQHQEFLGKRVAQQKLVVERALQHLQV
ncbi:hypothetical protein CLOP_g2585 [Closterium sp. NIES-67]|nr:hypothetical protein CLOP_g2585 [Closterium sp. NIES-67]